MIDFKSISQNKREEKKLTDDGLKSVQRSGTASVTSVETKRVTGQPPFLADLTGVQKETYKNLNLSAEEILSIAQSLYKKKISLIFYSLNSFFIRSMTSFDE